MNIYEKQIWAFGLIERETHRYVVRIVPDRTKHTLWDLILEHCNPGTRIHHDGFKAYQKMPYFDHGMQHRNHTHKVKGKL